MKKVLFMIPDLGQGGAEKVLVNLVNNMDKDKFDITVMTLFDVGVNRKFLDSKIKYKYCMKRQFKGNSKVLKLFTPQFLHKKFIKEKYDIEISYLEGPTSRIISGCENPDTKLVSWVHCTMHSESEVAYPYRNYAEAKQCYSKFDMIAFVSEEVKNSFCENCDTSAKKLVIYNTNESDKIKALSKESVSENEMASDKLKLCVVGKLIPVKAYDRMINIQKKLKDDGLKTHLYLLGIGQCEEELKKLCDDNGVTDRVTFLGYQTNPYKYISKCDLFVCSSLSEGFSTATTEALIIGVPVVTTLVSGMIEMLGANGEYGIITENNEDALYEGIKRILTENGLLEYYKKQAEIRGKFFDTESTVFVVETFLNNL